METILSRRAMFIGLLPKYTDLNTDRLEKGQGISRTIKTDTFEMKVIVKADKGYVLTSEQFKWYDNIEKEEKIKINNQVFLCGDEDEI